MLVAGSPPELAGFKRPNHKKGKHTHNGDSSAQLSVTHFTHPTQWPRFSTTLWRNGAAA